MHLLQEEWVFKKSSVSVVIMGMQINTEMSFVTYETTNF